MIDLNEKNNKTPSFLKNNIFQHHVSEPTSCVNEINSFRQPDSSKIIDQIFLLIEKLQLTNSGNEAVVIINELHNCFLSGNMTIPKETIFIDDFLFDYFLSELIAKSLETLSALIPLFQTLVNTYPIISSLLITDEFIENLFLLIADDIPNIGYRALQLIFAIFTTDEKSLSQSFNYLDSLHHSCFMHIKDDETKIQYIKYLDKLIRFHSDFINFYIDSLLPFLNTILPPTEELRLFQNGNTPNNAYKLILELFVTMAEKLFNTFAPIFALYNLVSLIIFNPETKNNSYQLLHLRLILALSINNFAFDQNDFDPVCRLVTQFWFSSINIIQQLSWETTFALLTRYNDSITIFMNEDIVQKAIDIYEMDIKYISKKFAAFSLFNIAVRAQNVLQDHFDEIKEMFQDIENMNIRNSSYEGNLLNIIECKLKEDNKKC